LEYVVILGGFSSKNMLNRLGTNSKIESETSLSTIITSADEIARAAFTVSRSGSPGPAPMSKTVKIGGKSEIPLRFSYI